jgi:excisionase family DNA binding protein
MKTAVRKNADLREIVKATLQYVQETNEFIASLVAALDEMPEPAVPAEPRDPAIALQYKEHMNVKEAAAYCGYSESYMYQLISRKEIPHYKPTGGHISFKRGELDGFMSRGKQDAGYEVREKAAEIINGIRRGRK